MPLALSEPNLDRDPSALQLAPECTSFSIGWTQGHSRRCLSSPKQSVTIKRANIDLIVSLTKQTPSSSHVPSHPNSFPVAAGCSSGDGSATEKNPAQRFHTVSAKKMRESIWGWAFVRLAARGGCILADHPIRSVRIGDRLERREINWVRARQALSGLDFAALQFDFFSAPASRRAIWRPSNSRESWSPSAGSIPPGAQQRPTLSLRPPPPHHSFHHRIVISPRLFFTMAAPVARGASARPSTFRT